MNTEEFYKSLKETAPLLLSAFATTLNVASFAITVVINMVDFPKFLGIYAILNVASLILLWAATIYFVRRNTRSNHIQDFSIVNSEDIYILDKSGNAFRKYTLSLQANRESRFYTLNLPRVSGSEGNVKAYKASNPNFFYDVLTRRSGEAITIDVGQNVKKGEKVTDICIEWEVYNSFTRNVEFVTARSEPGQKNCIISIAFPGNHIPFSSEWYCTSIYNNATEADGMMHPTHDSDGYSIISHN